MLFQSIPASFFGQNELEVLVRETELFDWHIPNVLSSRKHSCHIFNGQLKSESVRGLNEDLRQMVPVLQSGFDEFAWIREAELFNLTYPKRSQYFVNTRTIFYWTIRVGKFSGTLRRFATGFNEFVWISFQESVQFRASFMGPLPLQEYYELVDAHFEVNIFLSFRF